jgi:hypothetical protein
MRTAPAGILTPDVVLSLIEPGDHVSAVREVNTHDVDCGVVSLESFFLVMVSPPAAEGQTRRCAYAGFAEHAEAERFRRQALDAAAELDERPVPPGFDVRADETLWQGGWGDE